MAAQQTQLRVQTNIPDYSVTSSDGNITIQSETNISLFGYGTSINPFKGTSYSSCSFIFDVNRTDGIMYFDITVNTGYTQNIYVTHLGVQRTVFQSNGLSTNLQSSFVVRFSDTVTFVLNQPIIVNSVYFVPSNGPTYLYDNLDLYSSIPIKINRSYAELQDISKRNSDYSYNIQIPGSKKNNTFFENFYDVDVSSLYFNPNSKSLCQVLIDDEVYFNGYMLLNKINVLNSKVEYDVTLYSTVGNLYGDIGNNLLKDLNYNDPDYTFNHIFGTNVIVNSWETTNFALNQEQPQPFIYPIVHNGYIYSGDTVNFTGGTPNEQTHIYTSTAPIGSYDAGEFATITAYTDPSTHVHTYRPYRINSPGQGLFNNQLKPALSVWNLMKLLFKQYNYTIKSTFFNTPWMKSLYTYGFYSSTGTKFSYNLPSIAVLNAQGVEVIADPYSIDIHGNRVQGNTIVDLIVATLGNGVPCQCAVDINVTLTIERKYHNSFFGTDIQIYQQNYVIPNGQQFISIYLPQNGNPSDTIYRHYVNIAYADVPVAPLSSLKYFPVEVNSPVNYVDGDFVNFNLIIDPYLKQIDFLSSICKKFNLLIVPDPLNARQFIIEPFNYYVGTGDIWDWTEKISFDQGFSVEPALQYIDSNLTFSESDDGDYGNVQFKNQNNRIYGQSFIYGPTAYKSTTGTTTTIFGSEVLRQWDTNDQLPNGGIKLPLGINYVGNTSTYTTGSNGAELISYQYTGVKTKPKLMWYLGSNNIFLETYGQVYGSTNPYKTYQIGILNSHGTGSVDYNSIQDIPIVSHTMPMGLPDQYKINNDSACLLFNSETPTYIGVNTFNCYTVNSAYSNFYGNRINNVYNPNTRYIKGKFYLKLNEFKNLKPNDLIKIQNQYFIWDKINGYNFTNVELTEVELVQVNNAPNQYPTRYFRYDYCDRPGAYYKLKTDFTNPNLLDTNFGWSIYYDHQIGTLYSGGTYASGFTSMFYDEVYYYPFTTSEITEDEYNNSGYADWTTDNLRNYMWYTNRGAYGGCMPTYWENVNHTYEGLNLFVNCADCSTTAATYNINIGSSTSHG